MRPIGGLVIYAFAALPVTLARGGSLAGGVRQRWVGNGAATATSRWSTVGALPPSLVSFACGLMVVYLVLAGWLYPLRPDVISHIGHPLTATTGLDDAWGGPTLLGAWAVHALVALGLQALSLAIVRVMAAANRAVGA